MHEMNAGFDEKIDDFVTFVKGLISRSVVRCGALMSVTASEETDISRFISMLPEGSPRPETAEYKTPLPSRLGIQIPASVSHAVQAYDLKQMGVKPAGSISVASNILSLSFLWNEVRVKGGAYGTSVAAGRTGGMICYSYRDPSPSKSLEVYKKMPAFLNEFAGSGEIGLDGFIISTVASTEPLISIGAKGRSADDFWISGFSDEDRIRVRREILETSAQDLLSWKEAFSNLTSNGSVCVIGPRSALEACPDLEIVTI